MTMVATSTFVADYDGEQVVTKRGELVDDRHELVRRYSDRFEPERQGPTPTRTRARPREAWRL